MNPEVYEPYDEDLDYPALPQPHYTMARAWDWKSVPHPFVIGGELKIPATLPTTFLFLSLMKTPYLYHDGQVYTCFDTKKGKDGIQETHNYRCKASSCQARIKTTGWTSILAVVNPHSEHETFNKVVDLLVR